MTYLAKPKFRHPSLVPNKLGFTHRDYEGSVKVFQGQAELIAIATRVAGTLFHAGIVFGGNSEGVGEVCNVR